ncbi:MAG: hypothetical protein ONB37_19195 [candidate division KSB1 bacterium]|nr:hypothetical protein [candidate division KSB1 bacterium]
MKDALVKVDENTTVFAVIPNGAQRSEESSDYAEPMACTDSSPPVGGQIRSE